ncbi:MAG: TerC family protein [Rickettsiales bacterium]
MLDSLLLGTPLWMWAVFFSCILVLLAFDLGVVHRKSCELSVRQSLHMTLFYMVAALLFSMFVWSTLGAQSGKEYLTGYIVEQTLSMDNVFVMSLVFTYFQIPREYQYRVLFYGILGVIILRGIMIVLGAELVENFLWTLYFFGAFLVFTGVKMLGGAEIDPDIENNIVLRTMRRFVRVTPQLHGQKFFIRAPGEGGRMQRFATPLFAALVVIECLDLVFAVDSVPAIFAITTDSFIIYTSNIFAIFGLRALYSTLSAMIHRFEYLKYSLSLVLVFIGSKVFVKDLLGLDKFPPSLSLGVTVGLLVAGVVYSLYKTRNRSKA